MLIQRSRQVLMFLQKALWVALVALVPFSLTYVVVEPNAITYLDIYCLTFLIISALNVVIGNLHLSKLKSRSFTWVIGVLLVAMVWGLVNTSPISNGYGLWVSRLSLPILIGYVTYLMAIDKLINASTIARTLLISTLLLGLSALMQYLGVIDYRTVDRITGPYVTPNTLARYVEVLLLMALPWIISQKKYWYLLIWFVGLAVLIGTISYNGVITFFAGMLIMVVSLPREHLAKRAKATILTVMLLIAIFVGANVSSLPKYTTSINDSRLSRLEYWHVAWGAIKDHPLTGIGIKTWELTYPELVVKYGEIPPRNWLSAQPHNVVLDAWLKAGLPGVVAVLAFLLWPVIAGFKLLRRAADSKYGWYYVSLMCSMTALLLFGVIDDPIWNDDIMLLVMVLDFFMVGQLFLRSEELNA